MILFSCIDTVQPCLMLSSVHQAAVRVKPAVQQQRMRAPCKLLARNNWLTRHSIILHRFLNQISSLRTHYVVCAMCHMCYVPCAICAVYYVPLCFFKTQDIRKQTKLDTSLLMHRFNDQMPLLPPNLLYHHISVSATVP